jgi:hypothetical protein
MPERGPLARAITFWLGIAILAAAIYDGAIFYSRWSYDRAFERRQAEQEAERARRDAAVAGGDSLRIVSLSISPPSIRPGEKANLCYGVRGAKRVTLDPPVAEVWPALTHCVEVSPRASTDFKFTAEDGEGHSVSATAPLKVGR